MNVTSAQSKALGAAVKRIQASFARRRHPDAGDTEWALRSGGRAREVPLSAAAGLHTADREQAGHHQAAAGRAEPAHQMLAQRAGEAVVGDVVVAQMQDRDRLGAPSRRQRRQRGIKVRKGFCRGHDHRLEPQSRFRRGGKAAWRSQRLQACGTRRCRKRPGWRGPISGIR